jgi:hypothetical protein
MPIWMEFLSAFKNAQTQSRDIYLWNKHLVIKFYRCQSRFFFVSSDMATRIMRMSQKNWEWLDHRLQNESQAHEIIFSNQRHFVMRQLFSGNDTTLKLESWVQRVWNAGCSSLASHRTEYAAYGFRLSDHPFPFHLRIQWKLIVSSDPYEPDWQSQHAFIGLSTFSCESEYQLFVELFEADFFRSHGRCWSGDNPK